MPTKTTSRKPKPRIHNEYFQPLAPKTKRDISEPRYAWGEYVYGKWRTVEHFRQSDLPRIKAMLQEHANQCGCSIVANSRSGYRIPDWLQFEITPELKL